ncbi:MAG: ImmA/IrrE family metallo-endopeptidase [Oscillospiraceae bacterium]
MKDQIIKTAGEYLRRQMSGKVTAERIMSSLEEQGYTVVRYNSVSNSRDVAELADLLGVDDYIRSSKGFTYADSNNRIVFLNEDLSEEESVYVLLHEQGHILCRHFSEGSVLGTDVVQEHEANEFVHYVLEPTFGMKLAVRRKPIIMSLSVIIIAVIIISLIGTVNQQKSYYGEYYLTETGHKYHKADCIFVKNKTNVRRLTEEEFESGEFEACEMCLPE